MSAEGATPKKGSSLGLLSYGYYGNLRSVGPTPIVFC